MTVYNDIIEKLKRKKIHMTLIDPASQDIESSGRIAEAAERAGTDFIMIGGSTRINSELMDKTIGAIKSKTSLKTIIFPGSPEMISPRADAIYYMSLMNSRNIDFIIGHQVKTSLFLRQLAIETIPMAYLIFEPGMTVGRVGEANLIKRDDSDTALLYALAAETFGMKLVYLESGSGSPTYVSENVIKKIKEYVKIPVIVGGGIRDKNAAEKLAAAGADIIVTGTIVERSRNVYEALQEIISSI
ncbi:geranylgeranylglyceryl/heptaprenylglyceryl phosphate synthase [Picrophilus oshimae]|uniref:Geranylgeranylglyceryl phosphate synthase n=1 Tax=Picrophilus torridus (strain ATCC 700027 / DSM 9790 / JCM 10055 / NBRC 100828 / KAW 2/3) TaxID=1122961 RepID=GGGPS_PICTO|nr:geranylgeranylglyceryl/heptaprenylglyceryl phosphate synthase [Picrophilus oshimae]Q6L2N4.1 RecName: Full=Geranylgeranylglyceryl phosphate synthase; Short=GGGP synthase; Short=GGGPS; AltName: Full=(S)-3-O-geranylgeranylglyceryl phosphate synthase; AltName: Full=Phosphoglycerol geranylgeranyltransferase [Picrophilus oshimae DSM 9789]AAT42768.1 geranylgeranylglyceryl diphosphate synthase [Picrophilus oshimae DSM 9789]